MFFKSTIPHITILLILAFVHIYNSFYSSYLLQPHMNQSQNVRLNAPKTGYVILFSSSSQSLGNICLHSIKLGTTAKLQSLKSCSDLSKLNSCRYRKHFLLLLSLTLSGDIESNPGPAKFPCKQCKQIVKNNQKGICCDECDMWIHSKCAGISAAAYSTLSSSNDDWFCKECIAPCGLCNSQCKSTQNAVQCDKCNKWVHTACCGIADIEYHSLTNTSCSWICDICEFMNFSDSFFQPNNSPIKCTNQFDALLDHNLLTKTNSSHPKPKNTRKARKSPKRRHLKVLVVNFQSVKNKKASIDAMILNEKPDIIIGSETWLNPEINSSEIFPDNYSVIRKDRSDGYGGVLQAIKNDLIYTEITKAESDCETIWSKIKFPKGKSFIIGAFYRPNNNDIKSLNELKNSLQKMSKDLNKNHVLLAGDFNQPNIDWESNSIFGTGASSEAAKILLELTDSHHFSQTVHTPTRNNNVLDLVFTNNPSTIISTNTLPGISDHEIVQVKINIAPLRKRLPKRKIYLRHKANTDNINTALNSLKDEYFNKFTNNNNIDDKWNFFEKNIKSIIDKHIPHKFTSTRLNLPWFSRVQRRLCRRQTRLFKIAKKSQDPQDWTMFKTFRKSVHKNLKESRNNFISNKLKDSLVENPKKFWSYIKRLKNNASGVSDLLNNGELCSDSKTKANILNNQFFSAFTKENLNNIPVETPLTNSKISQIIISPEGVKKQLLNLDQNKASGPDNIPPWFLKAYASEVHLILTDIFKSSIEHGTIPSKWKEANICSIYKKGNKNDPANYRPVSLTCVCCKVLEHIIHSHVMKFLDANNILNDSQHGFRAKRSTETQLLITVNDLAKNVDQSSTISIAILDFSKAFDKVPHQRLLSKLSSHGIHSNLLSWFESFLSGRIQQVLCDGETSDPKPVISGVPQGTVLGPLLFLLYVNDLPDNIQSTVRLFADDCLVYRNINNNDDNLILQDDLDKLEIWQNKWQMNFNPSKCYILNINNKKQHTPYNFSLCNKILENVSNHPYLGVEIDNKLRWDKHINKVTKKANSILGLIKRNLKNCPLEVKTVAYKSLVRPILDYGSTVWDPHFQCDIDKLESVQRRSARFCTADYSRFSSVTSMLEKLEWPQLKKRRENMRLTMLYKINNELVSIDKNNLSPAENTNTRSNNNHKFHIPYAKKDVYKYSFFPRTIKKWNALPNEVVNAPDINCFKTKLISTSNN